MAAKIGVKWHKHEEELLPMTWPLQLWSMDALWHDTLHRNDFRPIHKKNNNNINYKDKVLKIILHLREYWESTPYGITMIL